VKPLKGAAPPKPVLLNVPRRVAIKVKPGTNLSFSASNDQKYVVLDSKIHPPVGGGNKSGQQQQQQRNRQQQQQQTAAKPKQTWNTGQSRTTLGTMGGKLPLPLNLPPSVSIRPILPGRATGQRNKNLFSGNRANSSPSVAPALRPGVRRTASSAPLGLQPVSKSRKVLSTGEV
jgi:hypothetical protein